VNKPVVHHPYYFFEVLDLCKRHHNSPLILHSFSFHFGTIIQFLFRLCKILRKINLFKKLKISAKLNDEENVRAQLSFCIPFI